MAEHVRELVQRVGRHAGVVSTPRTNPHASQTGRFRAHSAPESLRLYKLRVCRAASGRGAGCDEDRQHAGHADPLARAGMGTRQLGGGPTNAVASPDDAREVQRDAEERRAEGARGVATAPGSARGGGRNVARSASGTKKEEWQHLDDAKAPPFSMSAGGS
jgi:hypothetical protein